MKLFGSLTSPYLSAMYAANHFPGVKAIISLTESGRTPLIMSRIRSGVPIYCYTRHTATQRRVALFRGVYAMAFDPVTMPPAELGNVALAALRDKGLISAGDWAILTRGRVLDSDLGTDSIALIRLEE